MIASDRHGKFPEQMLVQSNAGLETFEWEIFIGRMGFAVGGGEAEEERIRPEEVAELLHDGNASALAHEGGRSTEGLLQGPPSGAAPRAFQVQHVGHAAVPAHDLHFDAGRKEILEMNFDQVEHTVGLLVGHQTEGELGRGGGRENSLGSFTLVAAGKAIDLGRGADADALEAGVTRLATEQEDTGLALVVGFADWK